MRVLFPVLLVSAAAAGAQTVNLSSAQSTEWVRAEFARADRNGDGELERGEVTQAVNRHYGRLSTGRSRIMTNMWFARLDGDKSNRISLEEAQAFNKEFWNRFDRNRDGRINQQEQGAARAFIRNPAR